MRQILSTALGKNADLCLEHILELYSLISAWIHPVARVKVDRQTGETYAAGILKAIIMPTEYFDEDIEDLKHLRELIEYTRQALAILLYAWSKDKDIAGRSDIEKHLLETLMHDQ